MSDLAAPKESLTAWQRWEMGSFDAGKKPLGKSATAQSAGKQSATTQPAGEAPKLPTADDIERIHQDAHKQGYDAGYKEGTARARVEAMNLHSLVEQFDQALGEFDQAVARTLLDLALEIARQVVRQSVVRQPERILDVVREALGQMPQQQAVLHLNPEDAALVRSQLGEQLTHLEHRIHEDAGLGRGGVRIEAGGSHLDASLENRWRRVIEGIGLPAEAIGPPP